MSEAITQKTKLGPIKVTVVSTNLCPLTDWEGVHPTPAVGG